MSDFSLLFRQYRERAGLSQNALARRMGMNPAYVNRLERSGQGSGNRRLVETAAEALGLDPVEKDTLLAAAGHLPAALAAAGPADPTLLLLANTLADDGLSEEDKQDLRLVVRLVVQRWRQAARLSPLLDQPEKV
jgi:transcriptional regulator with XRE-family HTH domain